MLEPVTIPVAVVDLTMQYARPNFRLLMDRSTVVEQLFERYKPWNIQVDDVEVVNEGKPSEQGIRFKLPKLRTTFFFGASQCRLSRDAIDWQSAEETVQVLTIGVDTLAELTAVEIATIKTSIVVHLQPKRAQSIDIIKSFAAPLLVAIDPAPLTAFATVLKWEGRRITIDGSAQIANGIFLKFERDFPGEMPLQEIATLLRADEDQLFDLLGVDEVQP